MYVFPLAHVCRDNPAMNQSNWMILGARESRDHQLSWASKIIKIRRQVFAGDDFEKNMSSDNWWNSIDFDRQSRGKNTIKIYIKEKQNYINPSEIDGNAWIWSMSAHLWDVSWSLCSRRLRSPWSVNSFS